MKQYAPDSGGQEKKTPELPQGIDMGIAYNFTVRARRYYKKGVRTKELKHLLEMVIVKDDDDSLKVAGRISYDMSGGFVVSDDAREEQWHVSPKEIWDAYQAMRKEIKE